MSVLVVYGSQTGTAEDSAEYVCRECVHRALHSRACSMDSVSLNDIAKEKCVIFVCSTTGAGEEPINMRHFWRSLLKRSLPDDLLQGVNYSVLGWGDSSYPKYNYVAKRLYRRLQGLDVASNMCGEHTRVADKLSRRLTQIRAARTLWHKDMNQFMDHIIRVDDEALSYDVMPWIIGRVRKGEKSSQPVSMGACQEFMPIILRFLHSERDEYMHLALVMVQSLLERFWDQLLEMSRNHLTSCQSANLESLFMVLMTTTTRVRSLTQRNCEAVKKEAIATYTMLEKL